MGQHDARLRPCWCRHRRVHAGPVGGIDMTSTERSDDLVTDLLDPLVMRACERIGTIRRGKYRLDHALGVGGAARLYFFRRLRLSGCERSCIDAAGGASAGGGDGRIAPAGAFLGRPGRALLLVTGASRKLRGSTPSPSAMRSRVRRVTLAPASKRRSRRTVMWRRTAHSSCVQPRAARISAMRRPTSSGRPTGCHGRRPWGSSKRAHRCTCFGGPLGRRGEGTRGTGR
jgi:hypothetical protein